VEAFYKDLEFGTGGLRGIMGVGSNRMNKYTVGSATQGLANYLKQEVKGEIKVAIAHDSRNNSAFFAEVTANVFAANGFTVYLFDSLRPTPELSFAIRHLKCHSGVVITASHNPKEYNGYKAYWSDGGQLVPPHDKAVMAEVAKISSIDQVKWTGGTGKIIKINKEVDEPYLEMIKSLSISPDVIQKYHDLKIVYTPIHGTGIVLVPEILKRMGFTNVHVVKEQADPNGDFPTVIYPNPEEAEALSIGLKKCRELNADILLGTDPDADRVGIAVKNHHGEFVLLNGNQTAALLFNYVVEARKAKGLSTPNDFICKTIVTTDLIDAFANYHGIQCFNVLTGFKYIAELIREYEGKRNFICGGEESYGYLIGDKVRDKDAVASVAIICEMAAYAKSKGMTLFDMLIDIYMKYGYYKEDLISLTKKGKSGLEEIKQMMKDLRANPPKTIAGSQVVEIRDYLSSTALDLRTGKTTSISLPKSDVLQFFTADGSKISARPSGTEPKIKFYFGVKATLSSKADFDKTTELLNQKIKAIVEDMKLK
ncbi:MAG: phospho-sugar mutase, partial [Flammeovirgaceae bacterium]|nr:phospho-sugar mutase [Flammeovirgaceae bacterium]MDW8288244.1 phospho-sugar mutase [Flammeovirgaceae bacterium]